MCSKIGRFLQVWGPMSAHSSTWTFLFDCTLYSHPLTSSLTKAACRLSSYPLATNTQSTFAGVWCLPSVKSDKVEGSPDKFLQPSTIWEPSMATRKDSSADTRNLTTNHLRPPHATSCWWYINKSYIYKNKYGCTEASVARDDPKGQPSLQALFITTMTLQNNVAKRTRSRPCHRGFWPWQQSTIWHPSLEAMKKMTNMLCPKAASFL